MRVTGYPRAVKAGAICAIAALFAVLLWLNLRGNASAPVHLEQPSYRCAFADKTFCPTEFIYARYVSQNDSSDLLDNQAPVKTVCSGANRQALYCVGVSSVVSINVFQIESDGTVTLYSRNEYITVINHFFVQYGPFKESAINQTGDGTELVFDGGHGAETFSLLFNKVSGGWKFIRPSMNT